jgi:hypothetical protein
MKSFLARENSTAREYYGSTSEGLQRFLRGLLRWLLLGRVRLFTFLRLSVQPGAGRGGTRLGQKEISQGSGEAG